MGEIRHRLITRTRTRINFVNAHCVNVAQSDLAYRACLERSELVLADGTGVLTAARMLNLPLRHNLNGTDLVPKIMQLAAEQCASVFLWGGRPGVAAEAALRLSLSYPQLVVSGAEHGFLTSEEERRALRRMQLLRPDILVVGTGVPKQESWIDRHWEELPVVLALGAGAFLDFAAGRVPRAPKVMRRLGVEWLYRLGVEPRRLWRRYLIGNVTFALHVTRSRHA